jgi:hypothetical protein
MSDAPANAEAAKPLTAAEVDALNLRLADRERNRAPNARGSSGPAGAPGSQRGGHRNGARRPLGLRPVVDDVAAHEASVASRTSRPAASASPASEAGFAEYTDPTIGLVAESNELLLGLVDDQRRHFENKLAGLVNTVEALQNENKSLRLILENLRITQRGERGIDGDRGPPGRDGAQGPPGPKGSRGQRGFETTGWLINEAEYCITPLFYDNSQGPTLNLRGLFEQFQRDTEDDDVALGTERAALSRASVELETERVRRGLPAK